MNPKLPAELQNEINQFKIDGFAGQFFAERRAGLFRQKVPIEKLLVYQKVNMLFTSLIFLETFNGFKTVSLIHKQFLFYRFGNTL